MTGKLIDKLINVIDRSAFKKYKRLATAKLQGVYIWTLCTPDGRGSRVKKSDGFSEDLTKDEADNPNLAYTEQEMISYTVSERDRSGMENP